MAGNQFFQGVHLAGSVENFETDERAALVNVGQNSWTNFFGFLDFVLRQHEQERVAFFIVG